jgi:predicted TIM-barrel fold metal-dependent hydrolase
MQAGSDRLGFAALETALTSAGIGTGIISWRANEMVDRLIAGSPWLRQLVWVVPGRTPVAEVRRRLEAGHVGLKLHPSLDRFPADDRRLDPYLRLAAEARVPVAVHSAPGNADPDRIRRLAERFGSVPVLLYHTYLGPPWGRRRAARHAQQQPNLYLETSWCGSREVLRLVDEAGPERVLFGSDGAVDGPWHYVRRPPNVEGRQTYNEVLLAIARELDPAAARMVLRDNSSRLFGLVSARRGSG